jgi:hypothetical protein
MSIEEDEREIEKKLNKKQPCPNCGHRTITEEVDSYVITVAAGIFYIISATDDRLVRME